MKITRRELKKIVKEAVSQQRAHRRPARRVSLDELHKIIKEEVDAETKRKRLGRELYKLDRFVRSGGSLENGLDARRALKAVAQYLPQGTDKLVGRIIDDVDNGSKLVPGDSATTKYMSAIKAARDAVAN